jgi:hypothetical protein
MGMTRTIEPRKETKGTQAMTATNWKKGDSISITTTTAGAQSMEIVTFVRRATGGQAVILATAAAAAKIRAGELDYRVSILTGFGGVREIETQYFHKLAARGLVVRN